MKNLFKSFIVCTILFFGSIVALKAQSSYDGMYLIDAKGHQKDLELFRNKDKSFIEKLNRLKIEAEKILNKETYSVTFHKTDPQSTTDVHDFYSKSPYYFVDPAGKAFMKDGTRNPKIKEDKDKEQLVKLLDDLKVLSIAYFYTKDERFAERARLLMDTWFINEKTKMNPNMNFAQIKPNSNQGTFSGIIESRELVCLPDVLFLLKDSKKVDANFVLSMRQWIKSYLYWLENSKLGKIASVQKNNQINYYNLQVCVFRLFTGTNVQEVRSMISNSTQDNIQHQINEKGEQTIELKRATPIGYSLFNLKAIALIALFSENIGGPDIWNYEQNGSGIKSALIWLDQQYVNQKNKKKTNPKFENILPGHLRGLYTLAQTRISNLPLSYKEIDNQSMGISSAYFVFN
jgi:hypothetical protein